jgi:hypothetical protein
VQNSLKPYYSGLTLHSHDFVNPPAMANCISQLRQLTKLSGKSFFSAETRLKFWPVELIFDCLLEVSQVTKLEFSGERFVMARTVGYVLFGR